MRVSPSCLLLCGLPLSFACNPPQVAGPELKTATTGDAFSGVQCSTVRPQTEPDLMAWDPGSRLNLNRIRRQGVVVVRYEAKGCDVDLEVLSNCMWPARYEFSPYSATEHKVARNANELFAELPIGAARLSGKLTGDRALRTDYMLVGAWTLPIALRVSASDLRGDCARATHLVSTVYVGGYAMVSAETRNVTAGASVFGAGASAMTSADAEMLGEEGNIEACLQSQHEARENERCAVPLRIGLVPLTKADGAGACPEGQAFNGGECVPKEQLAMVKCPPGMKSNGTHCFKTLGDPLCPCGKHFEEGRGCVDGQIGEICSGNGAVDFWCIPPATTGGPRALANGDYCYPGRERCEQVRNGSDTFPACVKANGAFCYRRDPARLDRSNIDCTSTEAACKRRENGRTSVTESCKSYFAPPVGKFDMSGEW